MPKKLDTVVGERGLKLSGDREAGTPPHVMCMELWIGAMCSRVDGREGTEGNEGSEGGRGDVANPPSLNSRGYGIHPSSCSCLRTKVNGVSPRSAAIFFFPAKKVHQMLFSTPRLMTRQ